MPDANVSRRNFSKLVAAAAGGLMLGSRTAFGQQGSESKGSAADFPVDPAQLLEDPNVCRGLNTCQGKGKGEHACAGQAACSTVEAHSCAGTNACKGQGGCGGYPGQNACNEHGHCAVPLSSGTWDIARKQFEHLMKDLGKEFGPAPAR